MHHYHLLEILAVGFTAALVFGYIAQRVGLSPIVGYLLAGFLVGPQSPGFVANQELALELSEAGVILLMFGVGLHFNLKDLMAVKEVALPGAVVQSLAATLCGIVVASLFGLSTSEGLILGLGLAVASTVVLLRVLTDNNVLNTIHGHVAIGWLIVEDIFTVLVLVLLPALAGILLGAQALNFANLLQALLFAIFKLAILWVLILAVGGQVVPWLLGKIVRTRSQELFTLTILVVAFLTAVAAAYLFDASFALGAFLGGMVVGKSNVSHQAGADLIPLRDAFAVLFFLSVGMLFDPMFLVQEPWLVLAALFIVLVVKPITAILVVSGLGYSVRTALTVATGLAQVGEFSFILAHAGQSLGLISQSIYNILVACALVSIALNPWIVRKVPTLEKSLQQHELLWKILTYRSAKRAQALRDAAQSEVDLEKLADPTTAVVVGFGPTGQKAVNVLKKKDVLPVVIEMNVDTVDNLDGRGKLTIYGDSTKKDILLAAGIESAQYLIITIPSVAATAATALCAKEINPDIRIFARARFLSDGELLDQVGVNIIAFEEEEVGITLAKRLLEDVENCKLNDECPA
jgi:Kef-type K+ transport system, predicted NAD-binding component